MRVCLDTTPLLGRRTGIGRYTEHLLNAMVALPEHPELVATAFTYRGLDDLPAAVPPGVEIHARQMPARILQMLWARSELPKAELIAGRFDVFHATNFILPPHRAHGVVTIHDLSYLHFRETVDTTSQLLRELVPRSIKRADVVCVTTAHLAGLVMAEYGVERDALAITPLGVDQAWLDTPRLTEERRAALGLPSEYLLFVSTIEPRKNVKMLLEAYKQLPADTPPLVIAGAAGWGEALDTSGIAPERLILPGYLELSQLREYVSGATLLATPSLDEGFGLPALEALACGTPVVVSDIAVFREVLQDQARFCDPYSAESIADALQTTLDKGGPTSTAARKAHAAARTWTSTAAATIKAYERAALE